MTPIVRIPRQNLGHVPSTLIVKILETSANDESGNGWNGVDKNGSDKNDSNDYNQHSSQGEYGSAYGHSQNKNDDLPEQEISNQAASSAVEIVHFTPALSSAQKSSSQVSSRSVDSPSSTLNADRPSLTSISTNLPALSNPATTSLLSKFDPVTSTSPHPPSVIYPSPTPYDYGGVVGGTPSSPSPPSSPQSANQRPMSSGIIVAIILSVLFVIVLSLAIYVITRPKFGSLTRLWKRPKVAGNQYPSRIASIASFEPKDNHNRQSNGHPPEDFSRPMSRSLLLPDSEGVLSPRGDDSGETTPFPPPAISEITRNDSAPRSQATSWRSSRTTSISETSRFPNRKHRSMNRIMSILEGYPFQHEVSSSAGINSRSESPNWSSTDPSVHGTVA